ncbi:hypothetical protein OK016_27180 [Vibrio chagasii]|nr:hypothetical protein [Vibrio chagasii]
MTFGDGESFFYPLVSLDVSAHEVSHGFNRAKLRSDLRKPIWWYERSISLRYGRRSSRIR